MDEASSQLNSRFYSHVNYSVTKIDKTQIGYLNIFYSHVNYSVTKILMNLTTRRTIFYSHVNYSVTKIIKDKDYNAYAFTVT